MQNVLNEFFCSTSALLFRISLGSIMSASPIHLEFLKFKTSDNVLRFLAGLYVHIVGFGLFCMPEAKVGFRVVLLLLFAFYASHSNSP